MASGISVVRSSMCHGHSLKSNWAMYPSTSGALLRTNKSVHHGLTSQKRVARCGVQNRWFPPILELVKCMICSPVWLATTSHLFGMCVAGRARLAQSPPLPRGSKLVFWTSFLQTTSSASFGFRTRALARKTCARLRKQARFAVQICRERCPKHIGSSR